MTKKQLKTKLKSYLLQFVGSGYGQRISRGLPLMLPPTNKPDRYQRKWTQLSATVFRRIAEMKFYLWVGSMIGLLIFFLIDPFGVAMDPEVSSNLALEQLENPSLATDTALRTRWAVLSSNPILWIGVLGTLVLYSKELISWGKSLFSGESK